MTTLGERCLDALALLGGAATSAEVCEKMQAGREPLVTPQQVSIAMACLARRDPPGVTGGRAQGSRLWRLTGYEAAGSAA